MDDRKIATMCNYMCCVFDTKSNNSAVQFGVVAQHQMSLVVEVCTMCTSGCTVSASEAALPRFGLL